jgi:spermidine synthase
VSWQQSHLAALRQRLDQLKDLPDGTLYDELSPLHHIRIIKDAGEIQFYFVNPSSGALDGRMSRMEVGRPLRLLAGYTQAAMLTLLWNPAPARVCLLGMAGGRLALMFYHYFESAIIDNVDIDPQVVPIASTYFGVTFDQRQRIAIQDARAFLESEAAAHSYDIIVMDAFRDATDNLNHLATRQFYQACRRRLAPGGVLCANILKSDAQYLEKVKTLLASFRHVLILEIRRSLVLFGSDRQPPGPKQIAVRAAALQREHGFEFPFEERAAALRPARAIAACSSQTLRDVPVLDDSAL